MFSPKNYAELYPEGIVNPGSIAQNEDAGQHSLPDEPPPAYTPTANPALSRHPGSSLEVPLNSLPLMATEENTSAQESTAARTLTAELANVPETTRVSELSIEHSVLSEFYRVHVSASSGLSSNLLPNSVQLSRFVDIDHTVSSESQNNTTHLETVPTVGEANERTSDSQGKDQCVI